MVTIMVLITWVEMWAQCSSTRLVRNLLKPVTTLDEVRCPHWHRQLGCFLQSLWYGWWEVVCPLRHWGTSGEEQLSLDSSPSPPKPEPTLCGDNRTEGSIACIAARLMKSKLHLYIQTEWPLHPRCYVYPIIKTFQFWKAQLRIVSFCINLISYSQWWPLELDFI